MPSPTSLGSINPLLMGADRLNNQQGFLNYNPYGYIPPEMMPMMSQEYARQMFNMQNPAMAFPQNMGSAAGNAIGQILGGAMPNQPSFNAYRNAGQQVTDPNTAIASANQANQPGSMQNIQGAQQQIMQRVQMYRQQGMQPAQSMYEAGADFATNSSVPQPMQQLGMRLMQNAKTMGYDENTSIREGYEIDNFVNPQSGQTVGYPKGSPEWRNATAQGWPKADNTPQLANGERRQFLNGGMYSTYQWNASKGQWNKQFSSTAPVTVGYTANSAQDAAAAGMIPPTSIDNAEHEKVTENLTNRDAATQTAIKGIDAYINFVNQNPTSTGKSGDLMENINNWRSAAANVAGVITNQNYTMSPTVAKGIAPLVDRFRQAGVNATDLNGMVTDLAYRVEAAQGNTDTDPSARQSRIEQIKEELLGDRSSDPLAVTQSAQRERDTLVDALNYAHENAPQGVMSKPAWLEQELTKKNTKQYPNAPQVDSIDTSPSDTSKKFRYLGGDPTDQENWKEVK